MELDDVNTVESEYAEIAVYHSLQTVLPVTSAFLTDLYSRSQLD